MAQTHHYLFDTATGFNDSTGSLNYTASNGSIDLSGKINECLTWNTSAAGWALTGGPKFCEAFATTSVCFWIKFNGYGQIDLFDNGYVVAKITITGTSDYLEIYFGSGFSPEIFLVLPSIVGGTWNHFVIISDGTTYWDFYVNNSYIGSYSSFSFVNSGVSNYLGSGSLSSFDVYVDDLRFYDSAIDATEVAFIYNSGLGTQSNSSGGGSALGSGSFPIIYVNPIDGTASGSAGPGAALGSFPSVLTSAPTGNANIDGIAFGLLSTVNVISFQGIAYPEFIAYGSLATITVSAIQAVPAIGTTIQLDYVACDGEVTWTQNLPITGFSSAIQGQDAISSRITPTIGASGANIVFFEQRTLAASGNQTYDLKSLTDFLGGALSLDRAYAIILLPTSGSVSLSPGASNPFQWFFASSTANISLSSQNVFMFAQRESATITSGSKTLKVTNTSGAASATYKIAILGGR